MWESIFTWDTFWWFLLFLYVPCCLGLIVMVLLQKGKSMGFAGAFGLGGGQDSIFGPRGGATGAARLTYGLAALFMVLALTMSLISNKLGKGVAPEAVLEESQMISTDLGDLGVGEASGRTTGDAAAPGEYTATPDENVGSPFSETDATDVPSDETAAPEQPGAP